MAYDLYILLALSLQIHLVVAASLTTYWIKQQTPSLIVYRITLHWHCSLLVKAKAQMKLCVHHPPLAIITVSTSISDWCADILIYTPCRYYRHFTDGTESDPWLGSQSTYWHSRRCIHPLCDILFYPIVLQSVSSSQWTPSKALVWMLPQNYDIFGISHCLFVLPRNLYHPNCRI